MSVDEVAVLRAAGLEASAKVIEAARAGQVAAQPPAPAAPAELTPGQVYAAEQAAAQVAAGAAYPGGPPAPAGKAPLQNLDEWEALPRAERLTRMDEADALLLRGEK
jgi:hypothetical protein